MIAREADDAIVGCACVRRAGHGDFLSDFSMRAGGCANGKQIDGHSDSDKSQENGGRDSLRHGTNTADIAAVKFTHHSDVSHGGRKVDQYSGGDKRGTEPERKAERLFGSGVFDGGELLQEQSEAGNDKAKAHEG